MGYEARVGVYINLQRITIYTELQKVRKIKEL